MYASAEALKFPTRGPLRSLTGLTCTTFSTQHTSFAFNFPPISNMASSAK